MLLILFCKDYMDLRFCRWTCYSVLGTLSMLQVSYVFCMTGHLDCSSLHSTAMVFLPHLLEEFHVNIGMDDWVEWNFTREAFVLSALFVLIASHPGYIADNEVHLFWFKSALLHAIFLGYFIYLCNMLQSTVHYWMDISVSYCILHPIHVMTVI